MRMPLSGHGGGYAVADGGGSKGFFCHSCFFFGVVFFFWVIIVVMSEDKGRLSRLPKTRKARASLLRRDPVEYVDRMGRPEIDKLLLALSKTKGLQAWEIIELEEELYE